MTEATSVSLIKDGTIGIIEINYPPVNALSQSVRQGLMDGIEAFESDQQIQAIVIRCKGRTFIAGADIKEFGKPPSEPFLPDVVNRIEGSNKPVIASLFGTSLGGGLEVALACHYRVALNTAKVGLPEVNLGLIPGAGGTQRLPRLVGAAKALEMVTGGKHYPAIDVSDLFDSLFDNQADLDKETLQWVATQLANSQLAVKRVGAQSINDEGLDWQAAITKVKSKARGQNAPLVAAQVLQSTKDISISEGMAIERKAFLELRESSQSAALRHAFGAEKMAAKTDLKSEPLAVETVGIIGGGNMGSGIATAFLNAGFKIILIEQTEQGLDAGLARIKGNLEANVKRGRLSQEACELQLANLTGCLDFNALAECELVLEAVFEDLGVKQDLFIKLDAVCSKDCIFATNTSYLDINAIASSIADPSRLVGMHFFSPAHIMKLLEVVKAKASSEQALATAMAVAKKLKKVSVLVGVCFGFAGNRMYTRYGREIQQMLLEGATIEQIDTAMKDWGMAMGPLAVQDMSGIDIGHSARSAQPFPQHDKGYFRAAAAMIEAGRLGRKTGAGFYHYDEKGKATSDAQAQEIIQKTAKALAITQQSFTAETIQKRAILALISEGLELYQEGIVQRLSDIDVIWLHGYGFPRYKGGPMFQAKQMGVEVLSKELKLLREQAGEKIWPELDMKAIS